MTDLCQYLGWDSDFFGRRIARVTVNRLNNEQTEAVLAWCAAERIECLYFLAEANNAETIRAVERHGFAFEDIRLTLVRSGAAPEQPASIRVSRPDDIPTLKAMARTNHRDSRFYFDGHFTQEECDALYETWIERSCTGYADAVLVAERDGQAAGYITCDIDGERGQIGLLGVGAAWQGQRIGPALIEGALNWFGKREINVVEVVTQGRNVRAQRAYQRYGFVTAQIQLWYHRWLDRTES